MIRHLSGNLTYQELARPLAEPITGGSVNLRTQRLLPWFNCSR